MCIVMRRLLALLNQTTCNYFHRSEKITPNTPNVFQCGNFKIGRCIKVHIHCTLMFTYSQKIIQGDLEKRSVPRINHSSAIFRLKSQIIVCDKELFKMVSKEQILDITRLLDIENLHNLINSVKSVEQDFIKFTAQKKDDLQIDEQDKVLNDQNKFWEDNVESCRLCNEEFCKSHENADSCEVLWKFHTMVNWYAEEIYRNWLYTDLETRKLTIFLGICDIKKYMCDGKHHDTMFETANESSITNSYQSN